MTDYAGVSITPICDPASGTTFPLGATTVTCATTDAAENIGSSSFKVTVKDTTPPKITVLGANPVTVVIGTTYTEAGATATDLVDGSVSVTTTGTVNTAVNDS